MRTWWVVAAAIAVGACGPPIQEKTCPPECGPTPEIAGSLWPMTTGSTWTYKINDPVIGEFQKIVTVHGPQTVPDSAVEAIHFVSQQPHLEEHSWQIEVDGLAKRVREDDYKQGILARVMTWEPDTIKALTAAQPQGWENRLTVSETMIDANGQAETKQKEFVWRVLSVADEVQVAGQTMKAIKVVRERSDKPDKERTYWFVPGIGKVKETSSDRDEELVSWDVKSAE